MKILEKAAITEEITKFVLESPLIAGKTQPGQFVLLMVQEEGERIPLTIVETNPGRGTITIVFQKVGFTTKLLGTLEVGQSLYSLLGPLGNPSPIKNYGKVIAVGGGVGICELLPVVKALKNAGNSVCSIIGGRTEKLVIMREDIAAHSDTVHITTDDGSLGEKGLVTTVLERLLVEDSKVGLTFCVGPVPMMKAVSNLTRPYGIKTIVCLNNIMIDGTGMCGGCRLTLNGQTKYSCVDGPDFDGHQVDFEELTVRQKRFVTYEQRALAEAHDCFLKRAIGTGAGAGAGAGDWGSLPFKKGPSPSNP